MKLQGGINFRDMGGYLTTDGRRVKKNRLYRSGSLSRLTTEDCAQLEALGVTDILDYRDLKESAADKDVVWNGARYECHPANPESHSVKNDNHDFWADENLRVIPHDFMESLYKQLPFSNRAYHRLFERVQPLETGALVQHCAVGKDRTGVGSALMLLSLGVSRDAVLEDYLRTEQTLQPFREQVLSKVESKLSTKGLENLHYLMSVKENFLGSALDAIHQRYGSMDRYFAVEYSLTPEKLAALKKNYLE
ncbi:tyrosine-protein phosphatase [Bdellovibrio bacteriovorus]|uniref:tyrosine-protein phosphatase n=1 Tax=Bdellovibrio bacteriovorus TaxID=959 RepID=UPI0035A63FE0